MYVGYADRYIYVEDREKNSRKKSSRKSVGLFMTAFVLGCVSMAMMIEKGNLSGWLEQLCNAYGVYGTSEIFGIGESSLEAAVIEEQSIVAEETALVEMTVQQTVTEPETVMVAKPDLDVVMLDPGHGGEDTGCERAAIWEKDVNLQIAMRLKTKLEDMGYVVLMTREEDVALTLDERIALANDSEADIYVSIHQNAFEQSNVSGMETWYCGMTEETTSDRSLSLTENSKRLAQLLHQDMVLYTKGQDRGIREEDELKVLRETSMPSCLVETGFLSNAEERMQLTDAAYQDRIVEGLASGIELYFHPKTMYLTFDDGPSAENTSTVLDILKEKNVKATFFVVGENVRKHPEVARRIVEEGHSIGIHCNSHDYDVIYESVDSYLADFAEAYEAVYEVTGVEVEIFRFPGGSINAYNKEISKDIIKAMTERGFIYYDWNGSLEDASRRNDPETILQNAKDSTLGRKKIVMLAHDIVYNTTLCLEDLIEQFPEYRMEPLTADVEPIQF